jgi:hypothetical protein
MPRRGETGCVASRARSTETVEVWAAAIRASGPAAGVVVSLRGRERGPRPRSVFRRLRLAEQATHRKRSVTPREGVSRSRAPGGDPLDRFAPRFSRACARALPQAPVSSSGRRAGKSDFGGDHHACLRTPGPGCAGLWPRRCTHVGRVSGAVSRDRWESRRRFRQHHRTSSLHPAVRLAGLPLRPARIPSGHSLLASVPLSSREPAPAVRAVAPPAGRASTARAVRPAPGQPRRRGAAGLH